MTWVIGLVCLYFLFNFFLAIIKIAQLYTTDRHMYPSYAKKDLINDTIIGFILFLFFGMPLTLIEATLAILDTRKAP